MNAMPPVLYDLIQLRGGLDQVTPTLQLPPGVVRRAANFECSITGGYTRIAGYERYDGRANPSDALYNVLVCTLTHTVAVGDTITGFTSGATGEVIAVNGGQVVITREVLVFLDGEALTVGITVVGSLDEVLGSVSDGATDALYKSLAADNYRADIEAVPGSGPVRGVMYFSGTVYAWRDNVAATQAVMYESSASGWQAVAFGQELAFDAGSVMIDDGDTITGTVSGATANVARVVLESGSWTGGNAAGRLILTSVTGTFGATDNLNVGGVKYAESAGANTQIVQAPAGRFEMVLGNFGGGAIFKIYGVDGVNRGFEFDGTVFVPIKTGMTVDTPNHVAFHKQHLFFSFEASLQFSGLGLPYQWSPLVGAAEIAMNARITNLLVLPGDQSSGALGVYTRNDTSVLYGTSSVDFKLSNFNTGTGALPYTAQNMDQAYVLDDRGVMSLQTTLAFGNFVTASLTMNIRPFIQARRNLVTASSVNREKGQYRLFFSDGTALYVTMLNGKMLGAMPMQLADPVTCCIEGETPDGSATQFFGSDDGFVYRLDAGTSFDGAVIPANLNLVFNSTKSPRLLKRYRKASVELTGDSYAEFAFGYDLGYRTQFISQPDDDLYTNDLRSAYWDEMQWDNFVWDGQDIQPSEIGITGTAENMGIRVSSVSALFDPFTVNNIIVHYTPRRGLR